jgi:hypothetical protein
MRLKEAVLKSLAELEKMSTSEEVYNHVVSKEYFDFKGALTPLNTIASVLGNFNRTGDKRVSRVKKGRNYLYFLSGSQDVKAISDNNSTGLEADDEENTTKAKKEREKNQKIEESLHKLLSTYLNLSDTHSLTISHNESKGRRTDGQKWTHPDMLGIKLSKFESATQKLLNKIKPEDSFKLISYEVKISIENDSDLKKAFFQAVSNSSWANYGYLVAVKYNSEQLYDEMQRLNQAFGIGIIELKVNPFKSKVLFPSRYRELDYNTIDKLSKQNEKFKTFVESIHRLLDTSDEKIFKLVEEELISNCAEFFDKEVSDDTLKEYCIKHHIPFDDDEFEIDISIAIENR